MAGKSDKVQPTRFVHSLFGMSLRRRFALIKQELRQVNCLGREHRTSSCSGHHHQTCAKCPISAIWNWFNTKTGDIPSLLNFITKLPSNLQSKTHFICVCSIHLRCYSMHSMIGAIDKSRAESIGIKHQSNIPFSIDTNFTIRCSLAQRAERERTGGGWTDKPICSRVVSAGSIWLYIDTHTQIPTRLNANPHGKRQKMVESVTERVGSAWEGGWNPGKKSPLNFVAEQIEF